MILIQSIMEAVDIFAQVFSFDETIHRKNNEVRLLGVCKTHRPVTKNSSANWLALLTKLRGSLHYTARRPVGVL